MDQATAVGWAAVAVAGATAAIAFGAARVQRGQRFLQEAEAHRQQAQAWRELAESWDTALLAAGGTYAVERYGVPQSKRADYLEAVERYREGFVSFLSIADVPEVEEGAYDAYVVKAREGEEAIAPYRAAVEKVVMHLAQVAGLVLRGRLSLDAAYDAFGLPLIRAADTLPAMLRSGYGHGSMCPAPGNLERQLWTHLSADQVCERLGWVEFLDVARATAERIVLFVALLTAHAVEAGDLDGEFTPMEQESRAELLGRRDRLAVAWRAARRYGFMRPVLVTWRLARVSRRAYRRRTAGRHPRWLSRFAYELDQPRWVYSAVTLTDWFRSRSDTFAVALSVARAVRRSSDVPDVRRMMPPNEAAKTFSIDGLWP
jgi:hypothetical protein